MKKYVFFILAITFSISTIPDQTEKFFGKIADTCIVAYDPLVVYVLMVKNEGAVIQPTLQTFIEDQESGEFIDLSKLGFFIFDTGSTDDTLEKAQAFFEEKNIKNFFIIQESEWSKDIHYANARNRGLDLAEQAFPNACFLIMPDAEWYLTHPKTIIQFCEKKQYAQGRHYMIRIMDADTSVDFYTKRLLRAHKGLRFEGKRHETIMEHPDKERVPSDCYFTWSPTRYGKDKSAKRLISDRDDLLREYEKNHDSRSCFYLGQVYACLNDWENSCHWYEKRTRMLVGSEELFVAHYRLAQIYQMIGKPWEESLVHYMLAMTIVPNRAVESLARIAEHYWLVGDIEKCFFYAYHCLSYSYPDHEALFVEKNIYDFHRYDILAQCAWHVGAYKIGKKALQKALAVHPEYQHLHELEKIYEKYEKKSENIQ